MGPDFVGLGQSSDVQASMTSKDKAGRLFISFGEGVFCGPHRAGWCCSSLSFCEFGFCYEVGLNKMAYAGQG